MNEMKSEEGENAILYLVTSPGCPPTLMEKALLSVMTAEIIQGYVI